MRLFSYKLTNDNGCAPNPFGHTLTLAICMPLIRKFKKEGDWLAGFTSKSLHRDEKGKERLIYVMRVKRKLSFGEYFEDKLFKDKRPDSIKIGPHAKVGDNIYSPKHQNAEKPVDFVQLPNCCHNPGHQERDVGGKYVLIAGEFYYFGSKPLVLPVDVRPTLSKNNRPPPHGVKSTNDLAERFIDYIRKNHEPGIHANPWTWPY